MTPPKPGETGLSLEDRCKKCGESLRRLMLLAMIQDAGARVYPSALECDHEF